MHLPWIKLTPKQRLSSWKTSASRTRTSAPSAQSKVTVTVGDQRAAESYMGIMNTDPQHKDPQQDKEEEEEEEEEKKKK